jgi:hypothetical protein
LEEEEEDDETDASEEERDPILTELELATLSAGGNRALSSFLKNEHGIIVGNLNAKDRVKFYKECRELRAYRVELAMASSMRMHALREEFKEFLDDYHSASRSNSDDDSSINDKNGSAMKRKVRKISDSLGSALTNIDKELMEEKRREEDEERQRQQEQREENSEGNEKEKNIGRHDKGDHEDEPRTPDNESKEALTTTTTTSSSLFSSPKSLLKSIDTTGLNKIGTWVQSMTTTATKKSSESTSLTDSNSDKENDSDNDEKREKEEGEAEERTGKEEDLLDEIETIAEAAAAAATTTTTTAEILPAGADNNDRNKLTNTSSDSSNSDSDELLNEIDKIVAEVDDDDNSEGEKEEVDDETTATVKEREPSQLPLLKTPSPSREEEMRCGSTDDEDEKPDITTWSGGSSRLASSPRSVRFVKIRNDAATTMQKHWRGSNERKTFLKQKHAAIKIQSRFRGSKARVNTAELRKEIRRKEVETKAAIKIQSRFRGSKARVNTAELRKEIRRKEVETKAAIKIQSRFRGSKARVNTAELRREIRRKEVETKAAIKIQSRFRGSKARVNTAELRKEIRRKEEDRAALEAKRERERIERQSAIIIQKSFKGMQQRKLYGEIKANKARHYAASRIQSRYRGAKTRECLANERKARVLLAALEKREAENEKKVRAAILLQARARGFLAKRETQELREFAKLKTEAKMHARNRVEERIEAKMNELRALGNEQRICA